jgi:hypothetical protein
LSHNLAVLIGWSIFAMLALMAVGAWLWLGRRG